VIVERGDLCGIARIKTAFSHSPGRRGNFLPDSRPGREPAETANKGQAGAGDPWPGCGMAAGEPQQKNLQPTASSQRAQRSGCAELFPDLRPVPPAALAADGRRPAHLDRWLVSGNRFEVAQDEKFLKFGGKRFQKREFGSRCDEPARWPQARCRSSGF